MKTLNSQNVATKIRPSINEVWEEVKHQISGKKVYIKEHNSSAQTIYAFADPELIGRKIKTKTMTFHVNPRFYKGELMPLAEALELLRRHPSCNIVGRLAYYAAKLDIVDKRSILWIKEASSNFKFPHLMLMLT